MLLDARDTLRVFIPHGKPTFRLAFLSLSLLASAVHPAAQGQVVPASASVAAAPTCDGDGLQAAYYDHPAATNVDAEMVMAAHLPDAQFAATLLDYPGGAADNAFLPQTITTLLGPDIFGGPHAQDSIEGFVFRFEGFLKVTAEHDATPGGDIDVLFALGSDDGSRLRIAGLDIVDNGGDHAFGFASGWAHFQEPGLYPIEVLYYNNAFGGGLEVYSSVLGGSDSGAPLGTVGILPQQVLYPAPPQSTVAVLGTACGAWLSCTVPNPSLEIQVAITSPAARSPGVLYCSLASNSQASIDCARGLSTWFLDPASTVVLRRFLTDEVGEYQTTVRIPAALALCGMSSVYQAQLLTGARPNGVRRPLVTNAARVTISR